MNAIRCQCFVHVPSSGGTTVWDILNRGARGRVRRLRCGSVERNEQAAAAMLQENPGKYQVIGGHLRAGCLDNVAPGIRYFTILRDPVERITSAYFRKVRKGELPKAADPAALAGGLTGFAAQKRDQMPGFLLGANWRSRQPELDMDTLLRTVDTRFSYIGMLDAFDDTIVHIARALGWKMPPLYDRRNRGGNKMPVDAAVKAELRRILSLEQAIYAHCRERFIDTLAGEPPSMRMLSRACRYRNNAYQTFSRIFRQGYADRYVKHE